MTTIFHTPFPPSNDLPRVHQRILGRYRHSDIRRSREALTRIERCPDDLPFGTPINDILNHYKFATVESAETFFRAYLARRYGSQIDDDSLNSNISRTINCLPGNYIEDEHKVDRAFCAIFRDLNSRIQKNSETGTPTVNFLVGPTGSGKTLFSKSLFSVCLRLFWQHRIIPTRFEYSKYNKRTSKLERIDLEFFNQMRQCQFRDLLFFVFGSRLISDNDIIRLIGDAKLAPTAENSLRKLHEASRKDTIDGQRTPIDSRTRLQYQKYADQIDDAYRFEFLKHTSASLGLKYAISFDGFDSTRIEHFLFDEQAPTPIVPLIQLLKGLHEKTERIQPLKFHTDNHYLLYLRDTTFDHLRARITSSGVRPVDYPRYWIIPPKYDQLVDNIAKYITQSSDPTIHRSKELTADIFRGIDKHVFDGTGMLASSHMAFLFGSNARSMKRHIRQTLTSSLYRSVSEGSISLDREASGIDIKTIWTSLAQTNNIRDIPRHLAFEDLFLNETRQLIPKLQLDAARATELLNENSFEKLIPQIEDRDQETGNFGCLFNYFYDYEITSKSQRQPAILLLIRVLQYVYFNNRCNSREVRQFIENLGYCLPKPAFNFILFVLIRTELIKWDGSTDARHINDVPLYLTTKGIIGLTKILYSTTYLSESICGSRIFDRELSAFLKGRDPDNPIWIADCLNNASIALYLIGETEKIEEVHASDNSTTFEKYRLYAGLREHLNREASAILRHPHPATASRWNENRTSLERAQLKYQSLVLPESQDGSL